MTRVRDSLYPRDPLFVVVAGLDRSGVLAEASEWVIPYVGEGGLVGLLQFSLVSVLTSNVVSDVPWVVIAASWLPHGVGHQREWLLLALTSTFAGISRCSGPSPM
jgi:Na+/H+ antiporter NhaD/arsenite permease-like protein